MLGLTVEPSKAREPYLTTLRDYYIKRDFPGGLVYEELAPMQCFDYWNLSAKEQRAVWKSGDWVAQEKLNGVRLVLHFVKGVGIFAHSRTVSAHTFRRIELTNHLVICDFVPEFTAVVDCEAVGSSLQQTVALLHMRAEQSKRQQREGVALTFHVLDIVNWQGEILKFNQLCERLAFLKDFQQAVTKSGLTKHFAFPPIYFQGKQEVFEKIIADGGEGVVLKNLLYHYEDSNSRSRHGWIKCKKMLEFDAYVSGYEQGRSGSKWEDYVSCLIFSVITEKEPLVVAKISNLPWQFRKDISLRIRETNTVKMDLATYGKVARISGLEMSQRARRLVHPRIRFWRSDLKQEECIYSMSDIEAIRMGVTGTLPLRIVLN